MGKVNTNTEFYNLKETGDKVEKILQSADTFSTQLNTAIGDEAAERVRVDGELDERLTYAETAIGIEETVRREADEKLKEKIESINKDISKLQRAYKAGGSVASIGDLPELSSANLGYLYNVESKFTTTSDFLEGAGIKCDAGTEVGIVDVGTNDAPIYKYNIIGGFADLSNYYTKSEIDNELFDIRDGIDDIESDLKTAIAADIKFKGENLFYPLDEEHYTGNTLFTDEEGNQYLQHTEKNYITLSQIPFTRTPTGSIRVDIEFATRVTNTNDVPNDTESYDSVTLSDYGFLYVCNDNSTSNYTHLKDGHSHTVEKRNIVVNGQEMDYEYHKLSIHHILPFNNAAQWVSVHISADKPSGLPAQQIDWRVYKLECYDVDSPALILDVASAQASLQKQIETETTARTNKEDEIDGKIEGIQQTLSGTVYMIDTGITIDDEEQQN